MENNQNVLGTEGNQANPQPQPIQQVVQPEVNTPNSNSQTEAIGASIAQAPAQASNQQFAHTQTSNAPQNTFGNQTMVGMSASQMGLNNSRKESSINIKKLIIGTMSILVGLSVVLAILIATNTIALSTFKPVKYSDSKGTNYQLTFYSKHTTRELKTGNQQLVSKVSEDGKFPLTLSISTSDSNNTNGYEKYKNCGSFTKVFDVQNNNLQQNIAVCDVLAGTEANAGVYIAVFTDNNQTHVITISQDISGADLTNSATAQQSIQKFGMQPYEEDIKKIVASIKVE